MKNNLIKLLTIDKEIRIYIVDATSILDNSTLKSIKTEFIKKLYTKLFANCCLLGGFLTENDQRLSISIRFKEPGCSVHCDIEGNGNINYMFSQQLVSFAGDFTNLVGDGATLSITRGSWLGGMFTGTVEVCYDSVDLFFSHFYSKSEQTETVFKTWRNNGILRGCMIQPLPFTDDVNMKRVMESVNSNEMYISSAEWSDIPKFVFPYARIIEQYTLKSECNCSKEMFFGMMMAVNIEDIKQAIQMNKEEELVCGICGKKYRFNRNDLETIVKIKER